MDRCETVAIILLVFLIFLSNLAYCEIKFLLLLILITFDEFIFISLLLSQCSRIIQSFIMVKIYKHLRPLSSVIFRLHVVWTIILCVILLQVLLLCLQKFVKLLLELLSLRGVFLLIGLLLWLSCFKIHRWL